MTDLTLKILLTLFFAIIFLRALWLFIEGVIVMRVKSERLKSILILILAFILSGCVSVRQRNRDMQDIVNWRMADIDTQFDLKERIINIEKRMAAIESRDCKPRETRLHFNDGSVDPGGGLYIPNEPIDEGIYLKIPWVKP